MDLCMMPVMAFAYGFNVLASSDASTFSGILKMATELLTWTVTSMTSIVNFISQNPLLTVFLIFTIVGFAVGILFRIWHSVG